MFIDRFTGEEPPGRPAIQHFVLDVEGLDDGAQNAATVEAVHGRCIHEIHVVHSHYIKGESERSRAVRTPFLSGYYPGLETS